MRGNTGCQLTCAEGERGRLPCMYICGSLRTAVGCWGHGEYSELYPFLFSYFSLENYVPCTALPPNSRIRAAVWLQYLSASAHPLVPILCPPQLGCNGHRAQAERFPVSSDLFWGTQHPKHQPGSSFSSSPSEPELLHSEAFNQLGLNEVRAVKCQGERRACCC